MVCPWKRLEEENEADEKYWLKLGSFSLLLAKVKLE